LGGSGAAATEPLIGVSGALQELRTQIDAATQHETPLLIVGEPGSGKEFLARLMHLRQYPRGPFLRLHCAALSDHELEQVFGDRESLSTLLRDMDDVDLDHDIEVGTLYLDGLERLSTPALRAFTRIMSSSEPQAWRGGAPLRMRVIAATLPSAWRDSDQGADRAAAVLPPRPDPLPSC
jgi:transcriptional regulator with AAA-type ATPase domain